MFSDPNRPVGLSIVSCIRICCYNSRKQLTLRQ